MNLQKLKDQLKIDEGLKLRIYFDTKGYPTMGYGHRITKDDPEYYQAQDLMLGKVKKVEIARDRAEELLAQDVAIAEKNCKKVFLDFEKIPENVQQILGNMMFNMGLGHTKSEFNAPSRFLSMEKFIDAVKNFDYNKAADEMRDSLWYREVKGRAARLTQEMRALNPCRFTNPTECENVINEKNLQRVQEPMAPVRT